MRVSRGPFGPIALWGPWYGSDAVDAGSWFCDPDDGWNANYPLTDILKICRWVVIKDKNILYFLENTTYITPFLQVTNIRNRILHPSWRHHRRGRSCHYFNRWQ
ncbi:MAG: hypothetical protein BWY17_03057 [Deltaproteobacteria bacterium ADurb.Bin207]|jgi:hypothetical protein|nr:MAG: hypothetical protein BWY17_03057 [Deltaproteobacteria bacterium ADurb.Bin207]